MNERPVRAVVLVLAFATLLFGRAGQSQTAASLFQRHTYQVWNTGTGLPQDTVRQFLQTRDGYLWMATDGGLVRFDGFDFAIFDRRNTSEMQSDFVNALLEDRAGDLWIATSNGLLAMKGGQFVRYTTREGLPSDSVVSLFLDEQGRVCAETSGGAACQDASGFRPSSNTQHAESRTTSAGSPRADLHARSADGTEWRVVGGKLEATRGQVTTDVSLPDGFSGGDILALFADREDNVWVGSENAGATIVRTPPFTTLGKKDGLAADQVRSLLQDARGDLWFGTSNGLTRLHDGTFSTVGDHSGNKSGERPGLASDEIIALTGTNADDLWIGTPDGLSHLQGTKITTLTASDGLPDDNIRSLLAARDSSVWIGTTHGLAHLEKPAASLTVTAANIHTYTTADGLASNVVGALLEDADGSVWVGTRAGLSRVHDGKVSNYATDAHASIITALGKDEGGTLWVGTAGGGLYALSNEHLLPVHAATAGLLPETVYGILDDRHGQLWLSSPDGVYQVSTKDLHGLAEHGASAAQPATTRYDVADGLRIDDCGSGGHPEAIRTADGHLFFATSKGVSVMNRAEALMGAAGPPVVLESVAVDDANATDDGDASGQKNGPTPTLHVAAGHERLAFHYAGLYFAAPSKVRYRYQLENFDRHWIEAGARRTAFYTNIPPGHYRFRVQASINGNSWSEQTAEMTLVMAPHYYQTWWFYTLVGLLLGLIAWQLYLYRLRQVELRFSAVLAERGRIAREIHDTLAQDIVAISVQLELVARLMTLSIDKAREQLVATRGLVRKSLAEARSSIWDLRSGSVESGTDNDLPTRIREMTRQVIGDAPVKVNFEITGTYRQASRELEDELLRIAQEAVTNANRHAMPQTIDVTLTYDTRGVAMRIRDDGRGFTPSGEKAGPAGHYGIRGMHERAERAAAVLTIESAPGSGTTVLAKADIR